MSMYAIKYRAHNLHSGGIWLAIHGGTYMYKLRLRNDEYNLLAKLLVELGSIEDDRNQRDRYMDILASVMSARDGCSLDYGEIAPILDVLSKCLNNVINFSIAIGCKSDELMELAASIALQLNEQNLDHFKIRR